METNTANTSDHNVDARSLRTAARSSCTKIEDCLRDNPQYSMLLSLGAGLGMGLLVGVALARSRQESQQSWFDRRTAEQFGQRVLANVDNWVPDAVTKRLGD